jgi:hypothetical protein
VLGFIILKFQAAPPPGRKKSSLSLKNITGKKRVAPSRGKRDGQGRKSHLNGLSILKIEKGRNHRRGCRARGTQNVPRTSSESSRGMLRRDRAEWGVAGRG